MLHFKCIDCEKEVEDNPDISPCCRWCDNWVCAECEFIHGCYVGFETDLSESYKKERAEALKRQKEDLYGSHS